MKQFVQAFTTIQSKFQSAFLPLLFIFLISSQSSFASTNVFYLPPVDHLPRVQMSEFDQTNFGSFRTIAKREELMIQADSYFKEPTFPVEIQALFSEE